MASCITVDINGLLETTQQHRNLNREGRLNDYKIARDELFAVLTKDVQAKMTESSKNGSYRAILFTGHRQEDGMYPQSLFFGKGDGSGKGIPFPSVWNPRGILAEDTLITKLRVSFQTETKQNLRFYVKRDLREQRSFHVFVDWSPRGDVTTDGGIVRPIRRNNRRNHQSSDQNYFITNTNTNTNTHGQRTNRFSPKTTVVGSI